MTSHTNDQGRSRSQWQSLRADFRAMLRIRRVVWAGACVLALAALMAIGGSRGFGSNDSPARAASAASAGGTLIESADVHIDDLPSEPGLEVNVSITETRNDCGTPLNGQICLRYGIMRDDVTIESGYGLIPRSALTVSQSLIMLRINTRTEPQIIRTVGAGGPITLKWFTPSRLPQPARNAAVFVAPTVQGSAMGYTIPSADATAGVILFGA